MLRPRDRPIAGKRADGVHVAVRILDHAVELDVVARHAVVGVARSVPLVGVSMTYEDATLPLEVAQSLDQLRCVPEQEVVRGSLAALGIPVVRTHSEAERDSLRMEVVGRGSQLPRV
jgi:hypothetical protein